MARLPFETTTVSANKSMAEMQAALQDLKFDVVGGVINGHGIIMAKHDKAEFRFEANIVAIKRRMRYPNDEQAERIAWRYLSWQVKSLCDGVKLGMIEVAQAFGGYLVFRNPENGAPQSLASYIIEKVSNGELDSTKSISGLIEHKGNV